MNTTEQVVEVDAAQVMKHYRKVRGIIKGKITRVKEFIERNIDTLTENEINIRIDTLEAHYEKYSNIQDEIDRLVAEDNIQDEINYSCDFETEFVQLKTKLYDRRLSFIQLHQQQQTRTPHSNNSSTVNITKFTAYAEQEETFQNFVNRLEIYMTLTNITDPKTKTCILLHSIPPQLHQKIYDLCAPDDPATKQYEYLTHTLTEYLEPQPSIWALQHKFINRVQEQHETIAQFVADLRKLTVNCQFSCKCGQSTAEMFLKLQFIRGLKDTDTRRKILEDRRLLSFKDMVSMATAIELAKSDNSVMKGERFEIPVNHIKQQPERQGWKQTANVPIPTLKGKCYRCGGITHRANTCRFMNEICHKCAKIGHLARVCRGSQPTRRQNQIDMENNVEHEQEHEINKLAGVHNDKFMIAVGIEGQEVSMELDTGAALSTISFKHFHNLNLYKRLHATEVELRTYTGERIKPLGVTYVKCCYNRTNFYGKLYVIRQDVEPIFGREWMREVKLDWAQIRRVEAKHSTKIDNLLTNYEDIFKLNIGLIPNIKGHLRLVEDARPKFMKPRQIPYAIKTKVEKELSRLEDLKIITKVDYSEWGTPIVPVIKPNGSVRICADYKVTVNAQIQEEKYPIPRIEDIFAQMNGGKYFCTLDLSNAYLHMEMDEHSANVQTLSTHKGLFKVNRLMFGVKVAPSLWQRFMDRMLQGLEGVQCFFDDIIIQGSTYEETSSRLQAVFERIRQNNLRLNRDKCKFFQKNIKYLGHIIDSEGLHKANDKIEAIVNSKRPENINELRTFLGLANYYNKFIPNLASILHPLNRLLQKNVSYIWSKQCNSSWERVNNEIVSDKILIHFNPELPLILATDASPLGLGAVISHRLRDGSEKPIAFASRSLTKSEIKYSQIDKEATAIYWGLKKFFAYCYGRKFTLITDHKPLVVIFNPTRTLPATSASRLFNYAHFLSGFNYQIEYRKTNEHGNADYLSRFPFEKPNNNNPDDVSIYHLTQLETLPVTKTRIAIETAKDAQLAPVLQALRNGTNIEKLGWNAVELSLLEGCIFRGSRAIIPSSLQKEILKELHEGHIGMHKMKLLARSFCYWRNIDKHIEELVKSCRACCLKQNEATKEPIHAWEAPAGPWQRIHLDFAGPISGIYFLIVVDAFSKWIEVLPTKCTTADWCIKQMRRLFATFGLPLTLVSDNGPQFKSSAFMTFLEGNGVKHKTTAPFHPATNGQAERTVQTVKKMLKAMKEEKGDLDMKLGKILVQMRRTINITGETAYKLMFGRDIRTKLHLMTDIKKSDQVNLEGTVAERRRPRREFEVGARVQARNYVDRQAKWSFGNIISREGDLHYTILLDDGVIWKRHVNQLLPCRFEGES